VEVAEQRRDNPALRNALFAVGFEHHLQQVHHVAIVHPLGHLRQQPIVPDIVEIAAQVDVDDACFVLNDRASHAVHRFMSRALGTITAKRSFALSHAGVDVVVLNPDGRRGSPFMKERYRENSPARAEPPDAGLFCSRASTALLVSRAASSLSGATVSAEDEDLSPSHSVDQGGRARAQGALESADASSRDRQEDETYREGAAAKGGDSRHWSRP